MKVTTRLYIGAKSVVPVNQVHHHFGHYRLFLCTAFGGHRREGDERIVIHEARSVVAVEHPVFFEEPQKRESRDPSPCSRFGGLWVPEGAIR